MKRAETGSVWQMKGAEHRLSIANERRLKQAP